MDKERQEKNLHAFKPIVNKKRQFLVDKSNKHFLAQNPAD